MHGLIAKRTNQKHVGVLKSYIQSPTADTVSLRHADTESGLQARERPVREGAVSPPDREAEMPSGVLNMANAANKKLWVNIAVLRLSSFPCHCLFLTEVSIPSRDNVEKVISL